MILWLLIGGVLITLSIFSSKLLYRFGIPTLLLFLGLGMLVGVDGPFHVVFDNAVLSKEICSIGLVFILFYGGFGMRWSTAKPVATRAILLSTVGVIITAGVIGVLAMWVLKTTLLNGLLLGAVVSCTDAASVFSILRTRNLNLKEGLAPLLEMESGSNDPMSYILTITVLAFIGGKTTTVGGILLFIGQQFVVALLMAAAMSFISVMLLKRLKLEVDGLYPILVMALVVITYAGTDHLGGTGYLAVYILGVVLGNTRFVHRRSMVHFFDGITWLIQIALFFTLGLLATPSKMLPVMLPALLIGTLLTLVARPLAVAAVLSPFGMSWRGQALLAWSGLRGVASIVFATFALAAGIPFAGTLFNIVFFICLMSILIQGAMIPVLANKLKLVDTTESIFITFNDYPEDSGAKLAEIKVDKNHPWNDTSIMDANIPESILVVMVKRGTEVITPKGSTTLQNGDILVVTSNDVTALAALAKGNFAQKAST